MPSKKFNRVFNEAADEELAHGEKVLARLQGRAEVNKALKHAVLLATDRRLLMVTKVWFTFNTRSLTWNRISAVDRSGFGGMNIEVFAGTETVKLQFPSGDIQAFLNACTDRISAEGS